MGCGCKKRKNIKNSKSGASKNNSSPKLKPPIKPPAKKGK